MEHAKSKPNNYNWTVDTKREKSELLHKKRWALDCFYWPEDAPENPKNQTKKQAVLREHKKRWALDCFYWPDHEPS